MIYIIIILPLILYAYFGYKVIRKYEYVHYAIFGILAIIGGTIENHNFLNAGFLGVSLFIIVMFTGVIASSKLKKRLMQVRAQYAIMGFIIISSHSIAFFSYLFEEGLIFVHVSIIFGVICYLVFVPLFITSFVIIRKQLGYKNWKKLHSFGYLGYLALFLHLYLINNSRQDFYLVLFSVYALFKIIAILDKYFTLKKVRKKKNKVPNTSS